VREGGEGAEEGKGGGRGGRSHQGSAQPEQRRRGSRSGCGIPEEEGQGGPGIPGRWSLRCPEGVPWRPEGPWRPRLTLRPEAEVGIQPSCMTLSCDLTSQVPRPQRIAPEVQTGEVGRARWQVKGQGEGKVWGLWGGG